MKTNKLTITLLGLLVAVLAAQNVVAQNSKYYNLDDTKIALRGYSPVSYFESGKPEMGNKNYKSEYDGAIYYFTSAAQKQTFDKNPDKYTPAYGGWCAFGVAVGGLFRIDPEKYKIVDGKLLIFLNDIEVDARKLWEETPNGDVELTQNAKANWKYFEKGQRPPKGS